MIVMKFGGSSVANAERIRHVAEIVKTQLDRRPALILSAMGDTTDLLLDTAEEAYKTGSFSLLKADRLHISAIESLGIKNLTDEIQPLLNELGKLFSGIALIRELTPRTKDYLVSFGERLSVRIAAAYFNSIGIKAKGFDAWDMGFLSDSNFGFAELLKKSWELIPEKTLPVIEGGVLPIVTGFIAKDIEGNITTLGRGGSDLSAAMLGAACQAEEVQFWKDVDGILTADPRIVQNAVPVETLSYEAASELAYFGAQVLHPRAMQPCQKTGTPVVVKNSYNINAPGTRIVLTPERASRSIQALSLRTDVTLVDIISSHMLGQYGFLAEVFACFARNCISVDVVATSEVSVSLTLDAVYDLAAAKNELSKIAAVEVKTGRAIVSIIGDVSRSSEILSNAFKICERLGVEVQMLSQGASKLNISLIVNDEEAAGVVKALHEVFFENAA